MISHAWGPSKIHTEFTPVFVPVFARSFAWAQAVPLWEGLVCRSASFRYGSAGTFLPAGLLRVGRRTVLSRSLGERPVHGWKHFCYGSAGRAWFSDMVVRLFRACSCSGISGHAAFLLYGTEVVRATRVRLGQVFLRLALGSLDQLFHAETIQKKGQLLYEIEVPTPQQSGPHSTWSVLFTVLGPG